jgi:hypothetical protein
MCASRAAPWSLEPASLPTLTSRPRMHALATPQMVQEPVRSARDTGGEPDAA